MLTNRNFDVVSYQFSQVIIDGNQGLKINRNRFCDVGIWNHSQFSNSYATSTIFAIDKIAYFMLSGNCKGGVEHGVQHFRIR